MDNMHTQTCPVLSSSTPDAPIPSLHRAASDDLTVPSSAPLSPFFLSCLTLSQAAWDAERQEKLQALRTLYARSMLMLGQAQKQVRLIPPSLHALPRFPPSPAFSPHIHPPSLLIPPSSLQAVAAVTTEIEGAREHAGVWERLAAVSLERGAGASMAVDATSRTALLTNDEAIYRAEVARAAALHERRQARRFSASATAAGASGGGGAGGGPHDASAGAPGGGDSKYQSVPPHVPPRESPFYGPYGVNRTATLDAGASSVSTSLMRVPQRGPQDHSSVIRVPLVMVRSQESDGPTGAEAGEAEAKALAAKREEERRRAAEREAGAVRRGSSAGRMLRESREGESGD
jgi:hypothetical protein